MKSGSWSSYQSALPPEARSCGERDDEPEPVGRHDHEPPAYVIVEWFQICEFRSVEMLPERHVAPVGRWFPAEKWAHKHAVTWKNAMAKRHGSATIEYIF